MSWLLLALSVWGALGTLAAYHPSKRSKVFFLPSFFLGWLTIELAAHILVIQIFLTIVMIWFGALEQWPGFLGLAILLVSWALLIGCVVHARHSVVVVRSVLADLAGKERGPKVPLYLKVFPFWQRRRQVRVVRNIEFHRVAGRSLKLDVFHSRDAVAGELRPAVLQIHGGGWVIGDKREQGIPLLTHLAANGWVGFNANYRLSPGATFPDHLVDLKRAVAWIREHGAKHGADPNYLVVTGGSAGGHLTALMALTANDPRYQPGFEHVDTAFRAAVPFYGVYDFTNRSGAFDETFYTWLLEPHVMKARFDEEPEKFIEASPIDRVHAGAPPFLVIHGDRDTLAPVGDARAFVERLREVSSEPVLYAEMRGSQHAFDVFGSIRTGHVIEGVERFLTALRRRNLHLSDEAVLDEAVAETGAENLTEEGDGGRERSTAF